MHRDVQLAQNLQPVPINQENIIAFMLFPDLFMYLLHVSFHLFCFPCLLSSLPCFLFSPLLYLSPFHGCITVFPNCIHAKTAIMHKIQKTQSSCIINKIPKVDCFHSNNHSSINHHSAHFVHLENATPFY